MRSKPHRLTALLLVLGSTLFSKAAEIKIDDISLAPDGNTTAEIKQTEITPLNGGSHLLPNNSGTVVYLVTTFTFGENSDAHIRANFNSFNGAARLGVEVDDDGLITFLNTNDLGSTKVKLETDLAGQSVTLLIKQDFNPSNSELRETITTGDDTLITVWVNPDKTAVEGSGITAGDMHALWNSNFYRYFTQTIQNQSTPGTAGASSITNTTILTGADATWAKALALATGEKKPPAAVTKPEPAPAPEVVVPSAAPADAAKSSVSASPTTVIADGIFTSRIIVTLKDAGGAPLAGKQVSLRGNGKALITTRNKISDANGVVTFSVSSSTVGTETFTAKDITDRNLVIMQTASVDFQEIR